MEEEFARGVAVPYSFYVSGNQIVVLLEDLALAKRVNLCVQLAPIIIVVAFTGHPLDHIELVNGTEAFGMPQGIRAIEVIDAGVKSRDLFCKRRTLEVAEHFKADHTGPEL